VPLKDPDSLADVLSGDEDYVECEDLLYATDRAYQDLIGEPLSPSNITGPPEPEGSEWEEDDLVAMFPRLAAKFP
jgi:hypothetical protein